MALLMEYANTISDGIIERALDTLTTFPLVSTKYGMVQITSNQQEWYALDTLVRSSLKVPLICDLIEAGNFDYKVSAAS